MLSAILVKAYSLISMAHTWNNMKIGHNCLDSEVLNSQPHLCNPINGEGIWFDYFFPQNQSCYTSVYFTSVYFTSEDQVSFKSAVEHFTGLLISHYSKYFRMRRIQKKNATTIHKILGSLPFPHKGVQIEDYSIFFTK